MRTIIEALVISFAATCLLLAAWAAYTMEAQGKPIVCQSMAHCQNHAPKLQNQLPRDVVRTVPGVIVVKAN